MAKTVKFTETILRDGQQSQIATRMPLSDMLPVLPALDAAGAVPRSIAACAF